jgi:hypothetical protein
MKSLGKTGSGKIDTFIPKYIVFQSFDGHRHDHQPECLLGGGSPLSGPDRSQPPHHQPGVNLIKLILSVIYRFL